MQTETLYCPCILFKLILGQEYNDTQWRAQDLFQQGQKTFLGGAENKSEGAESRPKGANKISAPPVFYSAPPAEFDSAPEAEPTRGGAEIKKIILYSKTGFKRLF